MNEHIKFTITKEGLCIQFETLTAKEKFISAMKNHGIDMFTQTTGPSCHVERYPNKNQMGQFVSKEQRLGLVFSSEKQKFYFKEYIELKSDCFMDMGPGYDAQMHFNEQVLPCIEGASLIVSAQ